MEWKLVNANSELTLKISYTKADLWRSIYFDSILKPLFWIAALIPAAIVFTTLSESPFRWVAAIAAALIIIVLIPYLRVRSSLKTKAILAPITFVFSDAGVSAEYVNGKNAADWSLVTGADENSQFIFVRMQRGSFHLIPKAQIGGGKATKLREILRQHVRKNVSLNSPN
jgi:hypothetical protein